MYLCEFLGIGQIVDSNGQEDVEKCICGGVKEPQTQSHGLLGGSNENMEGGDGDLGENLLHICVSLGETNPPLRIRG